VIPTNQDQFSQPTHNQSDTQTAVLSETDRQRLRTNAQRVMRESGLAEILRGINTNILKGRGKFEEYDAMILFKWGTGYTMRHMWIEIVGDTIRFRLLQHLKCSHSAPLCDGEYHTLTRPMWSHPAFLQAEVKKYYDRPVAETSSD
jgi:hypothetical protein